MGRRPNLICSCATASFHAILTHCGGEQERRKRWPSCRQTSLVPTPWPGKSPRCSTNRPVMPFLFTDLRQPVNALQYGDAVTDILPALGSHVPGIFPQPPFPSTEPTSSPETRSAETISGHCVCFVLVVSTPEKKEMFGDIPDELFRFLIHISRERCTICIQRK